jgi:hypothetical protein
MPGAVLMATKVGKYQAGTGLPEFVKQALADKNPNWDWTSSGEYLVLRMFDDGIETERVAAKIVFTRYLAEAGDTE